MAAEHTDDRPVVTFTDAARDKLREILDSQGLRGQAAIRVGVQGHGPGGLDYAMALEQEGPNPDDTVLDEGDFKVFVDADSLPHVVAALDEIAAANATLADYHRQRRDQLATA